MTIHSVVVQKLLSTNAHMGRRVAAHHFKIYACGSRNAMTIIDSDKTLICIRNACHFIGNLVRQKAKFLFVNTNSLCDEIVEQMTKRIGCKSDNSWRRGGFLTNSLSPKRFRGRNTKLTLGAVNPPDCVVIFDTARKSSVITEAERLQIPIVGLVDSSMPWDTYKRITYPVPANDSVQFVYLFCNLITKTFLYEQERFTTAALGSPKTVSEAREETLQIEQSKSQRKEDEIFVIPYQSLETTFEDPLETKKILDKIVVVKLNSHSGTKMGFSGPKSSLEICNGLTCLDLFVNEIESLNSKRGCNIPLLLVNTANTHDYTMKVLEKHTNKNIHTLLQHQVNPADYTPATLEGSKSEDEVYTADYHQVFLSLKNSGKLDILLSQGKEYIVWVNSDNFANVVDPNILNHMIKNDVKYCMEVLPTSLSNLEEGDFHTQQGKLQSKKNLKFTGTMWMDIKTIERLVDRISLRKDLSISALFDDALGISVPQFRYIPVEETSDLLILQSDLYSDGILSRNKARINPANPSIQLGPEFEKISEFNSRFKSIPSILELDTLKVTGDVWFGSGVILKGKVSVVARPGVKLVIPDGAVLQNKVISGPGDI